MATKKITFTESEIKNMLNSDYIYLIRGTQEYEIKELAKKMAVECNTKLATEISLVLSAVEQTEKSYGLWSIDYISGTINYFIDKHCKNVNLKTKANFLRTVLVAIQHHINQWKAINFCPDAKYWIEDYKTAGDIFGNCYLQAATALRMGKC